MRAFPVDREARPQFSQRFGEQHKGTDIFAPEGTPVRAVDEGSIRHDTDPKGGTVVYLTGADGWRYYYAHLSSYEGKAPRKVKAGEVIGYVGRTGNAATREAHLHFEVRPPPVAPGQAPGAPMDPFPFLQALFPQGAVVPAGTVTKQEAGAGLLILLLLWAFTRR